MHTVVSRAILLITSLKDENATGHRSNVLWSGRDAISFIAGTHFIGKVAGEVSIVLLTLEHEVIAKLEGSILSVSVRRASAGLCEFLLGGIYNEFTLLLLRHVVLD